MAALAVALLRAVDRWVPTSLAVDDLEPAAAPSPVAVLHDGTGQLLPHVRWLVQALVTVGQAWSMGSVHIGAEPPVGFGAAWIMAVVGCAPSNTLEALEALLTM
jgi:hypothetical protein